MLLNISKRQTLASEKGMSMGILLIRLSVSQSRVSANMSIS